MKQLSVKKLKAEWSQRQQHPLNILEMHRLVLRVEKAGDVRTDLESRIPQKKQWCKQKGCLQLTPVLSASSSQEHQCLMPQRTSCHLIQSSPAPSVPWHTAIFPNKLYTKIHKSPTSTLTSLMAQMVKNLPAMWKTWVQSLGWEDLLEKGMATHSSILAWRIPWTEEPLWATVYGVAKSRTRQQLSTMISATKHLFMSLFKVLVIQSCPTLCDFMDCSLCPWNSPGKNTGVGCHFPL